MDLHLLHLCQAQSALVRDLVASCAADKAAEQPDPARIAKLSKIAHGLASMHEPCESLCNAELKKLWSDQSFDVEAEGRFLRALLETVLQDFDVMRHSYPILDGDETGIIPGAREFRKAGKGIKALLDRIVREWPWIDYKMLDEATAACHRGEAQDIQRIIHELQGPDCAAGA